MLAVVRMLPADETKNTGTVRNAPSAARRRLLQGGLATGPVLMTVASRPVLGQTVCTASASCSVIPVNSLNHAHAHECEEAAGLSPDRWKAMAPDWPSPYVAVIAPVIQDPASVACTPTTATTTAAPAPVAPTTSSTLTRLAGRRTAPTSTSMFQYATTPTIQTTTTTTTTTAPVTCAPATASPTPTTPVTAPSAYDSYRTQRSQLYASRGLTGLISNPPAPAPTAPAISTPTAPSPQPTYATTATSAPAPTQTATTTSSSYVYRTRSGTSPFVQRTTSTPSTTTGTSSTPTVTSGPLVGPAGTNGTAFHCPTTGLNGQTFGSRTMLDVLSASGGAYDALGRYTVAALLNAKSGRVHVLPEWQVRNMWNDCITRGYYEPAAGVHWGAAEIVAYMQKTIA